MASNLPDNTTQNEIDRAAGYRPRRYEVDEDDERQCSRCGMFTSMVYLRPDCPECRRQRGMK